MSGSPLRKAVLAHLSRPSPGSSPGHRLGNIAAALRPDASRLRRRALVLALLGALVLLLFTPAGAFADAFSPESGGSGQANDIDTLYKIVFYIGLAIFVLVEGLLVYSIFKFRARRRGPAPAQIHGNTPLEIGWTVGAAVLVLVIAGITFAFLGTIRHAPNSPNVADLRAQAGVQFASAPQVDAPNKKDALHIDINGQQYIWRFDYIDAKRLTENRPVYSYFRMVVPTNVTVIAKINASDVIHSWWIPKLAGKADAVPGYNNYTWFRIKKPGIYKGQCAELCGEGHADMRAEVQAMPPDQYEAWIEQQRNNILAAQKELAAQRKAGVGQ
jgi:cytochrome c oxidase subunit II